MPSLVRLAYLPIIGVLFLIAAYFWSQRELKLRLQGQPAEGRIVGMVLQRSDHADMIVSITTNLLLTRANGQILAAVYEDFNVLRLKEIEARKNAAASAGEPIALANGPVGDIGTDFASLPATTQSMLTEIVRGDAEILRWVLLREGRRSDDPARVVRIEKTETIHGYFGVTRVPEVLGFRNDRLTLNIEETDSKARGVARIHTVFDRTDPDRLKANRDDSMMEYSYEREGKLITPENKNFVLRAEPYTTEFRPIFSFEANGVKVARLSHIGRRGGPTLALVLYGPCRVFYDQSHPEQAMVTALSGPVADDPLGWFSRFCEGLFSQWGSTSLIILAGIFFITNGLILISLRFFPSRQITPEN